ncbi:ribonuclease D [Corynebacterium epidermidicanis]|uniref:Ribonuclease D n=1 Tax=Corynebacterium epidermidicanis TaxID=1050174 RepID=A0A0G3GQ70_9CORY|nr:HRDC domain-containing protein [Corynebacterium epidermidicanis]AKK03299.1 ribonuclease D [Corynebacterium epidermidicanis]
MDAHDEASPEPVRLDLPRDGLPSVGHTANDFRAAAHRLGAGRGPIALDTERASEFRFDDRAFLVQMRRQDTGTILLSPEHDRKAFELHVVPVLNECEWVLHAAASDLPALTDLGLVPNHLFDTELAARLAGFSHVNLGALVRELLHVDLAKGHSDENWSQWPLPDDWIAYAALDVEFLNDLAQALVEILDDQGKLGWAEEEFEYIAQQQYSLSHSDWRNLKGIGKLRTPAQLQVAHVLWQHREDLGRAYDTAPGRILSNRGLVELASAGEYTIANVSKILRTTRSRRHQQVPIARETKLSAPQWHNLIVSALAEPAHTWPKTLRPEADTPAPRSSWAREFPEAHAALNAVRALIDDLAQEVGTPAENLLQPAALRELIWHATVTHTISSRIELLEHMQRIGVRRWQIQLTAPLLERALF